MKKVISIVLALVLVLTCAVSLTGCGRGDAFIVATNCPFAPFEYIGDDGLVYGIDMEIAAEFCKAKGYTLVIKHMEFDAILSQVSSGYADIGMAGLTINDARLKTNDFTDTYYNASQKIIVKSDCTLFDGCTTAAEVEAVIKGLDDGTKIGYQTGTTSNWYVAGDEDWGYEGFANIEGTGYDSALQGVTALKNDYVFAIIVDELPGKALVEANTGVKVIDVPLTEEEYAFAVKKGNTELLNEFNAFLAEIKGNGTFDAIVTKYFEGTGTKVGSDIGE